MKMNDIYNKNIKGNKLVEYGRINTYEYYIISIDGGHPCAYVTIDKKHPLYETDMVDSPDTLDIVHGGITYCEYSLNDYIKEEDEKWVFGWDYAHAGDYTANTLHPIGNFLGGAQDWGNRSGKKYSKEEIRKDIKEFTKFLETF